MSDQLLAPESRPELHREGWPIIEIFGPTIQGEGPRAGRPCYFVRFGGCDWRCSWCDSMFAVDPAEVRQHATRMNVKEIVGALGTLPNGALAVVLSGGNPALHHLGELVRALHTAGYVVHVETQGSVWRPWLASVDQLVISPKPPSSGMATAKHEAQVQAFMDKLYRSHVPANRVALKVVVFDETDYEWAQRLHDEVYPEVEFYLSVGTPQTEWKDDVELLSAVADRYRWLCERAANDHIMSDATILPQLHVVAWGSARAV